MSAFTAGASLWHSLATVAASLVLISVLTYFRRRHPQPHLRDWLFSWSFFIVFGVAALVDGSVMRVGGDTNPLRLITSTFAITAALFQLAWFILGCRTLARLKGFEAEAQKLLFTSLAVAGLIAGIILSLTGKSLQLIAPFHWFAFAVSSTAGALLIGKHRLSNSNVPMMILVSALGSLAMVSTWGAVVTGGAIFGEAVDGRFFALGFAVVEAFLALAVIISLLEDEREAAIAAATEVGHLAHHDTLTGLPNRTLLFDRLSVAMAHATRHKHKLAVLFIDLDRLKVVNDSLGHSVGDSVIRTAAERIRSCVRGEDTIARFGGDEFVVLLHIIARAEDASKVAQKMLESVSVPFAVGGREMVVTPSIGVAIYPTDGSDAETLLRNADTAMYRAKERGRNSYEFFAPAMNARAVEMLELESGLRRALARNEFVLHYQPLVDLEQGAIFGLEALLRWRHPELGLLAPDRFLPTAEASGMIVPIGNWVLREACRQAKNWQRQLGIDLVMSVNLAARQLQQIDLVDQVRAALSESGLRAKFLELEITETHAMNDVEKTIRILRDLKTIGVRISIDDFGTGYSSLSYLKQFPVDTLKLDQSFVREITVPEDGAIARGVIAMAHSLQLKVLAEGVETLGQLDFLRTNSCDRLQGFLFSRPLEPALFERFLAQSGKMIHVA